MPAFNNRLQPKEIFGIFPFAGAIGFLVFFVCGVLSLMLPLVVKVLSIPFSFVGFVVMVITFWLGDDRQFFMVMWESRFVDSNRVTSETRTDC